MRIATIALLLASVGLPRTSLADDWPQWLGPHRDSVWRETGIVERFDDDGLKVNWRADVGLGYSGPAVADGRVFVTDYVRRDGESTNNPGGRDKLSGTERVLCFASNSGKLLWKHEYDRPYHISYPGGPRCTPTVDAGKVYTLGAEGNLLCLNASDGKVIWSKDLTKEYRVETPIWGFAAHPLIDGDLLYCLVGGEGSVAVAFDKNTGREVWRSLSAKSSGYCSPTMIQHGGQKQLLIWHPESLNSLDPRSGKLYWSIPLQPGYGMSITSPRQHGDSLYVSSIGSLGVLLKLANDRPAAEIQWRGDPKTAVFCCNSTPFVQRGTIFGNDCQTGALMGVSLKNGKRLWQTFEPTSGGTRRASHGTAYLVKHKDRFFIFSETGDLILAKLSSQGYEELGRFHVLEATNECFGRNVVWSHPAFAQRSLFARNDKELVSVSLSASD